MHWWDEQKCIRITWSRSQSQIIEVLWYHSPRGWDWADPWSSYMDSPFTTSQILCLNNGISWELAVKTNTSPWTSLFIHTKPRTPSGSLKKSTAKPHRIFILLVSGRWTLCTVVLLIPFSQDYSTHHEDMNETI